MQLYPSYAAGITQKLHCFPWQPTSVLFLNLLILIRSQRNDTEAPVVAHVW